MRRPAVAVEPLVDLARFGDAPAVVVGDRVVSYADLDARVTARARQLGSTRRLVLLECANALDPLVTYLAALRGQHPVLLVPPRAGASGDRQHRRLLEAFDPDVVVSRSTGWSLEERRSESAHELHPELAVLLGTSGSTGAPKLVRLSQQNLVANATAIAGHLGLGGRSRAATTLPFHYSFGLSVVNSHLAVGASLWLTGSSVVDAEFWDAFVDAGATSFAGVPYTFELLERSGRPWLATPGLAQVQQAGGRLDPGRVRSIAQRAADHEVELFVMYGQTEATARMAYLPPHLAVTRPDCIGIPIDGGDLRIDPVPGAGERGGELVYTGPNVMLGYASSAADLALGRTTTELRTGDLGIQHDDGLFAITGRCNRVAKLFGVRVDLDQAERRIAEDGITAHLVAGPERLRAFVTQAAHRRRVAALLAADLCVPAHAVSVQVLDEVPRTANGKVDHGALAASDEPAGPRQPSGVAAALATVFGREVRDQDTFVALGGDSLLYVETYVRLEALLGEVPGDWPHRTVAELASLEQRQHRRWGTLETPSFLRAVAIALVIGTHTHLWNLMGGAHTLLALYGYGLARFALAAPTRRQRLLALGRSVRELVVPGVLVIGTAAVVLGAYQPATVLLVNNWAGPDRWAPDWQLWFLESIVWSTVAVAVLLAVPGVDQLLRRFPFAVPLLVLGATVVIREVMHHVPETTLARYSWERTAWLVALGWLVHAARTPAQRWLVTVLVPLSVLGFFPDNPLREGVIVLGVLALLWVPRVRLPRPVDRVVAELGSASLFIYLTHFHVYPALEEDHAFLAVLCSVAVGVAASRAYAAGRRWVRRSVRRRPPNTPGAARAGNLHEANISGVPSKP